ncbi:hypothetical protein HJC23_012664 [Cyclotella cryptica]|uniref:Uncharacterized protein n=1 Tax=Cyclotella cryptica TaxID=29204 RepID=A0ABD3QLI4_9STRA|eukprot:CCRYP_004220-RA/>CCRYP_004220-RA protein AED:0.24 eAED:0.24 QI:2766/1/1/1/1/0.66/3/233/195
MTIAKAFRKISFSCYNKQNVTKVHDDTSLVIINDNLFEKKDMSAPPSATDVHNCRSLTCIACSKPGTVVFVKANVPDRRNQKNDDKSNDESQASTASSSPSPSQRTLTPPSSVSRQKIVFENMSSVGVIRAFSGANRCTSGDELLHKPYKLTRSRSVSDEESLKQFIESIESADTCDEEDDIDGLIFGTPWKRKM